jgi:hypothetical protein
LPVETATDVHSQFVGRFEFGTDGVAPFQRQFWQELVTEFRRQYPPTVPPLRFVPESAARNESLDAYERSGWSVHAADGRDKVWDIASSAAEKLPTEPVQGRLVPLYDRTYFMFFNRAFLDKHDIPPPAFESFEGQRQDLRDVGAVLPGPFLISGSLSS